MKCMKLGWKPDTFKVDGKCIRHVTSDLETDVTVKVGMDDSAKDDLVKRISLKLHEASVKDLLFPARSPQTTFYDVGMVQSIVNQYMIHERHSRDVELEKNEMVLGHGSLMCVGKLIDGYLQKIAYDPNLSIASFIDLSRSISELARPVHDGLYKAIDIYLKEHPNLTKAERKKMCGLMDVKKLTMDASMHAAQNERLPLRVVVQVLFFEQVRAAAGAQPRNSDHHRSTSVSKITAEDCRYLKEEMSRVKLNDGVPKKGKLVKKNSKSSKTGMQLLPSRSRRIFDKLWVVGKGHAENRSSETSGSSRSPTSVVVRGDTKSMVYSSRQRRYSIF